MRRRGKPAKAKVPGKRPPTRKGLGTDDARVHGLEKRLAEALDQLQTRDRQLLEALEKQTATAEILRVISRSPTDLQPIFETILNRSNRLCEASLSVLWLWDGEALTADAHTNVSPEMAQRLRTARVRPHRGGSPVALTALEQTVIHVPDVLEDPRFSPAEVPAYHLEGARSILAVPMLRGGRLVGVINTWRREAGAFTHGQIELLKTFADQAVIAIENVRLFTELQEKNRALTEAHAQVTQSLDQQTATSEILRVISQAPGDLQPVLTAVAQNAARLCDARDVAIVRLDCGSLRMVAGTGAFSPDYNAQDIPATRGSVTGRTITDRMTIHVHDLAEESEAEYPHGRALQKRYGHRTMLATPLLREGLAIGAISICRFEIRPFSESQIALLKTFADQAVIAIENARLFNETKEALEQQTATSEILRVISSSPTDVQPVFDAIAANAARLCDAVNGLVIRFDGELLHLAAQYNVDPERLAAVRQAYPRPPSRGALSGRAILTRDVVHVPDVSKDPEYTLPAATTIGYRSVLAVPMMHEGAPRGTILVARDVVAPFSDAHIALIQTFADQAVIAIENVRLFKELQESNRELTTALDTQTATSDILRVISRSQTDVQPVFEAILGSAARLLKSYSSGLTQVAGDRLDLAAFTNTDPTGDAFMQAHFPLSLGSDDIHCQAVRDRAPVVVTDVHTDPQLSEGSRAYGRARGWRSAVVVPMLRHGEAIGSIGVSRREAGGFTGDEIGLLQTFADQAVIAVENVRLFTELQEKNRALTEAHAQVSETLEQQVATGAILTVIASSPTDVQPVLDAVAENAARLCHAEDVSILQADRGVFRVVAYRGASRLKDFEGTPVSRGSVGGRAILDGQVVHVHNITEESDAEFSVSKALAQHFGHSTMLAAPLLRKGTSIGAIFLRRTEVRPFSDKQIELLRTFADQAVIAIENVRLFNELKARTQELAQSVGQLTALGEVGRAVSSTLDLETVLTTIISRAVQLSGLDGGTVFEYDEAAEEFVQRAATGTALPAGRVALRKGEGVVGRTASTLEPVQVPDIVAAGAYEGRLRETLIASGARALLAVPMLWEGRLLGGFAVNRNQPGDFPSETVDLLRTFATQSALAIQNARLYHEIADKSRQLEAASRHKSEFLANMSHELRTPLNAVIGFSEVLLQRMFGDLNAKQDEYLKDIYASGQHLLSLINDILDLSKIEAGRMELAPAPFHLPTALENAVTLVRERASRHGIALELDVDAQLGELVGDERKVKQVLLNLLSNAVKFTPEGGRICLKASRRDGAVEISVTDTGIGIAPEDQATVFEEFRQVGSDETRKQEGTGLGLTLAKKFVELHGGQVWVESEVGRGSVFTFTLPMS